MSVLLITLTCLSLLGLLIIAIYHLVKVKNLVSFIIQLLVITGCFVILYVNFFSRQPTGRESQYEVYFVIILYACMLLGMFAHYAYSWFGQPKSKRKKKTFDFGLFIAPIFASPVIFIPLLAALQNTIDNLQNMTTAKMMVFFVAFENGFFWKEYFDNRKELQKKGTDEQ